MMNELFHYKENLPDDLNVRHKISEATEKKIFHLHKHAEIVFALSDNLIYRTDAGNYPIPKEGMVLIGAMTLHKIDYVMGRGLCDRFVLYFNPELILNLNTPEVNLLDCFTRQCPEPPILIPSPEYRQNLLSLLQEMADLQQKQLDQGSQQPPAVDRMNQLLLKLDLGKLLLLVNQVYQEKYGLSSSVTYQAHSRLVAEVCQYMDEHFADLLSVDLLSKQFGVSKTQLYNLFNEVLGMSVSDYLSQVRMTQAKFFLINTDYSVELISQKSGYTNISSFSRVFKSRVGAAPLQYRKQMGNT